MGGCWSRHLPSTEGRRPSWRPIWPRLRCRASSCRPTGCPHLQLRRICSSGPPTCLGPNDFDETLPGPWEWDVKRMAASVEIAGRDIGFPAKRRHRLVTACLREYREGMAGFAAESHLDVWYDRLTASELVERFGGRLGQKDRIVFSEPFAKARRKTSLRALTKLTERVHGEVRFRSVPPLLVPLRDVFEDAHPQDQRSGRRNSAASMPRAWTRTGGTCLGPTVSWTWLARSWELAASAPALRYFCLSAATGRIRWYCRRSRPRRRSSNPIWARASSTIMANGWCGASESHTPRPISS